MEDITNLILSGQFVPVQITADIEDTNNDIFNQDITLIMLNRRPKLKKELICQLEDLFTKWEDIGSDDPEPDDFIDNQLLNAINSDPQVKATILEAICELDDVIENEGEPFYRPSIFDTDVVSDIIYREDVDESLPAKYAHLSEDALNIIYSNADIRMLLSKKPAEKITETLVLQLAGKLEIKSKK